MWQKKRKRNIKIGIGIFLLVILGFGLFMFFGDNVQSEDTLEKFNAVGSIPVSNSFIALTDSIMNPEGQFFTFVNVKNTQTAYFMKTTEQNYVFHHTPNQGAVYSGAKCKVGEVIRFKFCTDPNNKGSCFTDMFDELWQVHKSNDYPIFRDFYVNDMDFYYSYTCYEPLEMFPDTFERRYLYNNKCVSYDESQGKGTDYEFENFCLEALQEQQEAERIAQEKAEALRQEKLRLDNLEDQCQDKGGTFTRSTEKCVIPTTTTTTPTTQPTTEPNNTRDTTTTPTDNTQTTTTTTTSNTGSIVSCKTYEKVEDNKCSFSISKVFSSKGFSAYWNEEPLIVVFAGLVLLILVIVFVPKKSSGGKKK